MKESVMNDLQAAKARAYWQENIRTLLSLLSVWFVVSYGMGVLFADALDGIRFFGFKLGFWMAQQGSLFTFVILIFIYVRRMNRLDHQYEVDEDKDDYVPDEPGETPVDDTPATGGREGRG